MVLPLWRCWTPGTRLPAAAQVKTTLLLDADIIAFQLAATSQKSYQFPGMAERSVSLDDWEDQPPRIDRAVSELCARLETDEVIVCLSCPTAENWRLAILPSYKANRDYSQRPEYLGRIKDYLEATYPSYRRPTLEADDIMGILSTHPTLVPGKKVIVSEDKDMNTIPGWLFNPRKDRQPRLVTQEEADYCHMFQTLTGDSTDGYTGCPGIGKVKAGNLLRGPAGFSTAAAWPLVVSTFESKGLTEADALIQARVSRICRASDYQFKTKEVIPWGP